MSTAVVKQTTWKERERESLEARQALPFVERCELPHGHEGIVLVSPRYTGSRVCQWHTLTEEQREAKREAARALRRRESEDE
jgi:hypothetical protein